SPPSAAYTSEGGSGSVAVTALSGCSWSASANDGWISISSGNGAVGSGTVLYSVAANSSTSPRTGTMTIAGQPFSVSQSGAASTLSLGQAVDNTSLIWTTGGEANWVAEGSV